MLSPKRWPPWGPIALLVSSLPLGAVAKADTAAQADPGAQLTPIQLYSRCYATIARSRVLPTQRYYGAVQAGTTDPIDACLKVLSDAAFASTAAPADEKTAVIQSLADFHRTWFKSDVVSAGVTNGERYDSMKLVYNGGEPGLHLTNWAFGPTQHLSTVLTETSALLAVRQNGATMGAGTSFAVQGRTAQLVYNPPLLTSGELSGIQRMADVPAYAAFSVDAAAWPTPVMPFAHFGGGVLGTQEFMILNYGRTLEDNDGGLKVPRRWSKAIINDLLCREIPILGSADVTSLVDLSSPIPFRQQASCMACHATLDGMAGTARNIRYVNLDPFGSIGGIALMAAYPVDASQNSYAHSAPAGRLYYRSYDNTVVDLPLTNVASLGSALAGSNDFYACVASRYLEYFTGVHVSLAPVAASQEGSAATTMYRNLVIAAGLHLKTHGNLAQLLKELLNNDFYKTVSMRSSTKVQH